MMASSRVVCTPSPGRLDVVGSGSWTASNAAEIAEVIEAAGPDETAQLSVDMAAVSEFDTYGAWLLERLTRGDGRQRSVSLTRLPERFQSLFDDVRVTNRGAAPPPLRVAWPLACLADLGKSIERRGAWVLCLAAILGGVTMLAFRAILAPRRIRFVAIVNQLDRVGVRTVPIVALIMSLVGAIIAQQGFFNFRRFGADAYVVDLIGFLILRELGVLIVAIMVAGRSGSSYTAELGSMAMREEIDALRTMGRDPIEVLILPRIIALIMALPLLTVVGELSGVLGGAVVAALYGMEPGLFFQRLQQGVSISDFEVGLIKAPFMAALIGLVACAEGMQVKGSSESLGLHTTSSVVSSIFLIIVLDALFAIFFSLIGM